MFSPDLPGLESGQLKFAGVGMLCEVHFIVFKRLRIRDPDTHNYRRSRGVFMGHGLRGGGYGYQDIN